LRVGPDGKPQLSHFGDAKSLAGVTGLTTEPAAREPLSDVIEGDREVSITVELPGVEKKDIRLHVGERRVSIEVDVPRRYRKVLDLPAPVKPSTAKATHKNGVLDLTIERAAPPEAAHGTRVDIE
ncbi:MAG TPA: Hsp20/alpha crystallin family protein, partial [Candidatus Thermoplasmatota archaeon]|nr:Hsp20/alpha crystallin family protein [Candidatus Thermoplasmatota archaeon]